MAGGAASADDKTPPRPENIFKLMDTNNDGVITHDELMAHVQAKFASFDKNKDGFLVLDELPKEMPMPQGMKRGKKRFHKGDRPSPCQDGDCPMGAEGRPPMKAPTRMQFMARFDRNGDEKVSLEEFAEPAVRHFKRMDLNGDGKVTKDEAQEAHKERFRKMRDHRPMRR
ncbi:EF-hand domain-containing protein [Kordiimonas marina]|uniref:EF-hand domain-containing protein n=1 Tax=Kordiimonas marina TaxID=2872312 RepID=UPI001FF3968F|nr:EF-hand domain-containing protein [Kordiimonas marina]MCJ9429196.1 EF-hand domain-containing protein [Kordiimonas marina]